MRLTRRARGSQRAEEGIWKALVGDGRGHAASRRPLFQNVPHILLVFIHLGTHKVFLSPPTYKPGPGWVRQQGRAALKWLAANQLPADLLIHDHDSKFTPAFVRTFENAKLRRVQIPILAPNANAFIEAWIGALKRECLNHFTCFSRGHLNHIGQEYVRFHNQHRPHRGLQNRTVPEAAAKRKAEIRTDREPNFERVRCQRFLAGLLKHYHLDAA